MALKLLLDLHFQTLQQSDLIPEDRDYFHYTLEMDFNFESKC